MSFEVRRNIGWLAIVLLLLGTATWAAKGRPLPSWGSTPVVTAPAIVLSPLLVAANDASRQARLPTALVVAGQPVTLHRSPDHTRAYACKGGQCVFITGRRAYLVEAGTSPRQLQAELTRGQR